jgi:hypothetical protein
MIIVKIVSRHFLAVIMEDIVSFPFDVTKVNNGYIIVGYNRFFKSFEPIVSKIGFNGSVLWSKTLTNYMHVAVFEKVLTTMMQCVNCRKRRPDHWSPGQNRLQYP